MAQVGDTVRYLNQQGGGKIVRIDGKIAYVEDNGFDMPVLLKDLVVVQPAGTENKGIAASLYFDQEAYNKGKQPQPVFTKDVTPVEEPKEEPKPAPADETSYGDRINLSLAFEPSDYRNLSKSSFNAVLVNDSNYTIAFTFLIQASAKEKWEVVYAGQVERGELIDLASFATDELGSLQRIALQYIAYKEDKSYELKSPGSIIRRLDLTKFYRAHCFQKGLYFDTPVLEYPLVKDDVPVRNSAIAPEAVHQTEAPTAEDKKLARQLADKYRVGKNKKKEGKGGDPGPHRLLPLIEVDLHINQLLDNTNGMTNTEMLNYQLDQVRKTMKAHERRIGQKIVFIHGKGDGVLRKAVTELLKKEWPNAELQDASFAEYGFGATLVTIHQNLR